MGGENPLPPIACNHGINSEYKIADSVPDEDRRHLGWGYPGSLLPYRLQDNYDRSRTPKAFQVVVLENKFLRAVFFPSLGGRLWSLANKLDGRELLARNPVFQPCNLGLRNAWLSGGVEWNFGWTGHWPYTCSPLFAAKFRLPDGGSGLRMWEWERVRQMPLRIDAWLPEDSRVLFVRVSIRNPSREEIPVYWWSNISVEEHEDTRVIVPADDALVFNYERTMRLSSVPVDGGNDNTYPALLRNSMDIFYRIPSGHRPWITALDGRGRGLFQTSTSLLHGRKLFRWGKHVGGKNWQRFLCTPDYIEIQAGLARTQSHCLPMPAGATWTWIEAYGDLHVDAGAVHGNDWRLARRRVEEAIEGAISEKKLEGMLEDSESWAGKAPGDLVSNGSGWGALEVLRRKRAGEAGMEMPGIFFPLGSMGVEQEPWIDLLERGVLTETEALKAPASYQVQREWMQMLEKGMASGRGRHWSSLFHYGVMQWRWNRRKEASRSWRESLKAKWNPWAERCLGIAALLDKRYVTAVNHLRRAIDARPDIFPLVVEYLESLRQAGRSRETLNFIGTLRRAFRKHGRVRLHEGYALLKLKKFDALESLLADAPVPVDMREGNESLKNMWFGLQYAREEKKLGRQLDDSERSAIRIKHPCPAAIDYRQKEN